MTATKTFTITTRGERASVLVARGNYSWVNNWITDERFPIEPHNPTVRTIELIAYDCDMTSEEFLEDFIRRSLERPTAEDAFYFSIEHTEEQRKRRIVFLHDPVRGPGGNRSVLVLGGGTSERTLGLGSFDDEWNWRCVFAGVRKSG